MTDSPDRFDRNIRLFGAAGQRRIRAARVLIAGAGGNGMFVAQEVALLGAGHVSLVEPEYLAETNRNRYPGAWHNDPIPGSAKVDIAERHIKLIDPSIAVTKIQASLLSAEAFEAVRLADYVFGCFDHDGPRFVLNELCAVHAKPYFDIATDVSDGVYGGRVCVAWDGTGCLHCLDLLDMKDVRDFLATPEQRENDDALYGVERRLLDGAGPSVVSINGVVASIGVTEWMASVTGLRRPVRLSNYYGTTSKVVVSSDQPRSDCYYCKAIRGRPELAGVERYLSLIPRAAA